MCRRVILRVRKRHDLNAGAFSAAIAYRDERSQPATRAASATADTAALIRPGDKKMNDPGHDVENSNGLRTGVMGSSNGATP